LGIDLESSVIQFCNLILRYFAFRQKKQEYNWYKLKFGRFGLPCLQQAGVFPAYGRQVSSAPISEENKATGAIADIQIL